MTPRRSNGGARLAMLCFTVLLVGVVGGGLWWVWRVRQRFLGPLEQGQAMLKAHAHDEAIKSFERAREARPGDPAPLRGLAACYLAKGRLSAAATWAEQAIACDPTPDAEVLAGEIELVAAGPWAPLAGGSHLHFALGGQVPNEDVTPKVTHAERLHLNKAAEHAGAAVAKHPNCGPAYRILAEATARLGDLAKAEGLVRRAVELDPDARTTRLVAADLLSLGGNLREALGHCRYVAERLDPLGQLAAEDRRDLLRAAARAAAICAELKLSDQAIVFWNKFLVAGGDKVKGHTGLVLANYVKGDYARAFEESSRAVTYEGSEDPSQTLHYYRGLTLMMLKRYDQAADELRIAASIRNDSRVQYSLGMALSQEGDLIGARGAFVESLALDARYADARQELVKLLEAEGEVGKALDELRRGVALAPADRTAQDQLANFCLRRGLDAEAEEALSALHQLKPPSARAAANLCTFYLDRGNPERALPLAREAMSLEPTSAEFAVLLGRVEAELGRREDAAGRFELALRLAREYVPAYLAWTAMLETSGGRAQAQEIYERARKAVPNATALRCAYARFCIATGREDEGVDELKRVVDRDRLDLASRIALVDYFLSRGQKEEALGQAREAVDALPRSLQAYTLLIRVHRARGEWDKLLAILRQAAQLPDGDATLAERLAAHMHEGLYDAALELAKEAIQRHPGQRSGNEISLGILRFLAGRREEALAAVSRIASADPRNCDAGFVQSLMQLAMGQPVLSAPACREFALPDVALSAWADLSRRRDLKSQEARQIVGSLLRAYVYERAGWLDTAAGEVEAILGGAPDCLIAYCIAPVLWERAGDRRRAIAVCERGRKQCKGFVHGQLLLGELLLLDGQVERAKVAYAAYAATEEAPFNARTKLALLAEAAGDRERAIEGWRDILRRLTRQMPASNNLAWLLAAGAEPDLTEAAGAARAALDAAPEDPSVLDTVGWVNYLRGEGRRALDTLETAAQMAPYDPSILLHLGLVRARTGQKANAEEALRAVVDLAPSGQQADVARQALRKLRLDDSPGGRGPR